ncbi:MAG: 1-deoxy-D-xylulose-5-phosphate reductoisomerase [Bacteroidaceae bacterium]|nr:1-deoxy-D-xylulose-5-phosphate reductoisomerase [Bacteroidaceae bacterium]
MKRLAILGSTGSIGTQTLDVIRQHPDRFEAYALTANNSVDKLIEQAREYRPEVVVIANEAHYEKLQEALADLPVKVFAGAQALCEVVQMDAVDTVVTAMVGFAGLRPTVAAIKAHKTIALANKETLVVAGQLMTDLALQNRAAILPVDSEHSAIFQSLVGEDSNDIAKILLTASGGPFRKFTPEQLRSVTCSQALQHPNWQMGAKITIDSATMMNKGFEVIEARWLFGVRPEQIEVYVHPESIVHSAVEFQDGAVKAQLGVPDMRLPIQYALTYPERLPLEGDRLDLFHLGSLTFERPDLERFPCLGLAYDALARGGNMPCIVNAANEVANLAFRKEEITYGQIAELISKAMQHITFIANPTLDDLFHTDAETRQWSSAIITQ